MRFGLENEQTWSYKGYQGDSEVNFQTGSLLYHILTPKGERLYLGANLSKQIVNEAIDHHITHGYINKEIVYNK